MNVKEVLEKEISDLTTQLKSIRNEPMRYSQILKQIKQLKMLYDDFKE